MVEVSEVDSVIGRKEELQSLLSAIKKRESRLVWGATDSGKTTLIKKAISELSGEERRSCICWTGPASGKQLLSHFVGQLFKLNDPFVRTKVLADGANDISLSRWLQGQKCLRLRGILFTASKRGRYCFFLDDFPPATHNMARLMKEMMYRCATPVYLAAQGYSQGEIGYAWSLYWNNNLRVHLGPLNNRGARGLLESCIRRFRLDLLELEDFREEILHLSGHIPGSIVKMCKLAANSEYHYGDRIKVKLVHVDYLMRSGGSRTDREAAILQ